MTPMYRFRLATLLLSGCLMSAGSLVAANDSIDAAVGSALGAGVGAYVGNEVGGRQGAMLGGALGAAAGAARDTDYRDDDRYWRDDDRERGRGGRGCPPGLAKQGRCW